MKRYCYTYRHNGLEYYFDILADSLAEAEERKEQMSLARYEGTMVTDFSVPNFITNKLKKK